MVKEGKYEEALKIIMEELPLPGVLGRICPHPCEDSCRRCDVDQAVAIRDLKRLAADQFDPRKVEIPCAPRRNEMAAIIGSGPAGLSAAYHLARKGVGSTIFEALSEPGGMLRTGIPAHRLPREILDQEIQVVTNLGVEIKTNTPIGPDLTVDDLFEQGYQAVYIAIGAHKGFELGIPGESAKGVRQGVDFLKEVNLTGNAEIGQKVAVIGGGNVAVDVARCAVRLGAGSVNILYRRSRAEMPAWEEEILAAESEGVEFTYLAAPQEVLVEDGRVVGLRCIRMELGEPDSSGRRRPVPIPGSEYDIEIDHLIPAIGQRPDLCAVENITGVNFSRWGTIETDAISYATGRQGVFAGGDVQTGPWVAIGAVAAGREAAESIVRYLDGKDLLAGREPAANENPSYRPIPKQAPVIPRIKMAELDAGRRKTNFKEVTLGYDAEVGTAEAGRCLNCGYCCECYQCVTACGPGAVTRKTHDEVPEVVEVDVGSVILAPGFQPFDPSGLDTYQYGRFANVVTSIEFERILSAGGPTGGHVLRPSDQREPARIAWLQCVGSRDINRCSNEYCSSVCCMYAIKEAQIAKEHIGGDFEPTIFFMDIRTHGKDFEKYYERAKGEGVRFIRSRVHTIDLADKTGTLALDYVTESGDLCTEKFDMVVLSVGMEPAASAVDTARKLDIELSDHRFVKTADWSPVATSRPGVYVAGVLQGCKDIPQSVVEASAAACRAAIDLAPARGTLAKEKHFPSERDIADEPPRIGVFVCNCGINIGGIADVPALVEYSKNLPGVVHVEQNLFTCSQDTQVKMQEVIDKQRLNRIVVAACTPRTHEPLFQETIRSSGLNAYLFDMANIRNQCTWVHSGEKKQATEKSKDLIRMAVARVSLLEPIPDISVDITKAALVVGGGVAGMTAALSLADQGYPVTLIEKSSELGGAARHIGKTWRGQDVQEFLSELVKRLENHPRIEVIFEAQVVDACGFVGNFETRVSSGRDEKTIFHGVTIIATGGRAADTDEYLYGQNERVTRWHDIEQSPEKLAGAKSVVFIQCVGSRDEKRPYCSGICCTASICQAIGIKEQNPEAMVYILYRDIRTYGERETLYKKARAKGIIFIRYSLDRKPEVRQSAEGLSVDVFDPILQRNIQIPADVINLATAIEPVENDRIASIYKLPLNEEKFFMEAHAKLKPVDFATDGVFVCGLAHYPKSLDESIAQAMAAAGRAGAILAKSSIQISPLVSQVDTERCIGCGLCSELCAFNAIILEEVEGKGYRAKNVSASCKGCGLCAASCPQQAIDMLHFREKQIVAAVCAAI